MATALVVWNKQNILIVFNRPLEVFEDHSSANFLLLFGCIPTFFISKRSGLYSSRYIQKTCAFSV